VRIFPKIKIKFPRHPPKIVAASPVSRRRSTERAQGAVRMLDLSSAIRGASSVENLYESLVDAVARAFSTPAISLFIRDDDTGDFSCRISTAVSRDAVSETHAQLALSSDSFVIRRLKSLSSPLQLDAAELSAWQLALTDAPPSVLEKRMRERDVLLQTRSSLLVQLRTKGDLLGVLALATRESERFNAEQREMLDSVAGQLALVIENTKLLQRLVEHERLRAELTVAAEVQRNLLPATGLKLAGIDLCGVCQPASQVGGDYFDHVPLGDDRVGICIADVAGKGISAALMMSVVQASLRGQLLNTQKHIPAKTVVSMLNRLICGSVPAARYVTCFYGQLNVAEGSFRFVNAGHNPPLLLRRPAKQTVEKGVEFQSLSSGGLVLGLFPDGNFEEGEVQLRSGDVLVAYTDGVTEAMNVQQEEFSEERLRTAIAEVSQHSAREILDHIMALVSQWSKGAPQHDDITVVVLKMD
jgi:sigma-B regulation protein RsbU (phosphoserine phosphatase)